MLSALAAQYEDEEEDEEVKEEDQPRPDDSTKDKDKDQGDDGHHQGGARASGQANVEMPDVGDQPHEDVPPSDQPQPSSQPEDQPTHPAADSVTQEIEKKLKETKEVVQGKFWKDAIEYEKRLLQSLDR